MKRIILLILVGFFLIGNSNAGEGLRIMESRVMISRILKQEVHFSVCLPEIYYKTEKSFPVVYLLHGLGDDETSWIEYGRIAQFADKAVEDHEAVPMIFVMPEGFRTYYVNDYLGSFLYQDMFIKELVPYIDSLFRTIRDRNHRALMGYSMGGFGALILHLKYPDLFGTAVPLSISVRTDEQYIKEDAKEWDQQWGRLFGAPGFTGTDRITAYYKQNSPFYLLSGMSAAEKSKLNIYIDNGDKEQTLCRSNEELLILMKKLSVPHEYRVRDGGHSFGYWCSALPNALRFISDGFEANPYRGDLPLRIPQGSVTGKQVSFKNIDNGEVGIYVPAEYERTDRLYPVAYFAGKFTNEQRQSIAETVYNLVGNNEICPMLLVFLPVKSPSGLPSSYSDIEQKIRIRPGFRFQALIGFQQEANDAFSLAVNQKQFGACILSDGFLEKETMAGIIKGLDKEALSRLSLYIDAPDKGNYFEGNGMAHMLMRDDNLIHEYRVREGDGGFGWFLTGLPDMISFAAKRFHR
ncbi:MAG: alpha/beta hydrolase-fold protein [Bacteroidales bacterium]|jgi:enterochelin esterase-like enzyme